MTKMQTGYFSKLNIVFKIFLFIILISSVSSAKELLIYSGAGLIHPVSEIISIFERENRIKIKAIYGGSGEIFAQAILRKEGDIFLPGAHYYTEIAVVSKIIFPE